MVLIFYLVVKSLLDGVKVVVPLTIALLVVVGVHEPPDVVESLVIVVHFILFCQLICLV